MRWLADLLLDEHDRRIVEAELGELYAFRRARDGEPAARRWLARQRRVYPLYLSADRCRDGALSMVASMLQFRHDLRYAFRSLRRTPALALTVVLTIGVGLGKLGVFVGVGDGPVEVPGSNTITS